MFKVILFFFAAAIFSGCAVNVHTIYDKQVDFGKYKTFCWMNGCEFKFSGPAYLNDSLMRSSIQKSIISELKKKGLTQDLNNPDLLVGLTVTMQDEQAIIYHRAEDTPFYRPLENDNKVVNYLKGTLVLGMADKKDSKMVWESFAVSYMDLNPDFSEKEVLKGIKLVLKDFPPKK